MQDIVLATLNARYIHSAFGLRYLLANLGELQPRAVLLEFNINQRPLDIVETIFAAEPRVVGMGVYIWNVTATTEVVALLKRLRPEIIVILGGPEVRYETDGQEIVALANHVITGEADLKFAEVCRELLDGATPPQIISAALHTFDRLPSTSRRPAAARSPASFVSPHSIFPCAPCRWNPSSPRWSACSPVAPQSSSSSIALSTCTCPPAARSSSSSSTAGAKGSSSTSRSPARCAA